MLFSQSPRSPRDNDETIPMGSQHPRLAEDALVCSGEIEGLLQGLGKLGKKDGRHGHGAQRGLGTVNGSGLGPG